MNQEITKLAENSLIEKSKSDYIIEKFNEFTTIATEWNEKANAIVVTDESQKDLMLEAREGRLLLKAKRIEIEKTRKSLKEQSLNEGRLIDGIAKTLTALVEPAEKHLELQERFAEIQDQKRKAELKAKRYELMLPYIEVLDPNTLQLDIITEEAFVGVLNYAKTTLGAKVESDRVAKEEKELLEKALADEKENLRLENDKLRLEAIENQKKINELKVIDADFKSVTKQVEKQATIIKTIEKKEQLISDNVETLKSKLITSKLVLETALQYIIHDDLRKLIEKTLKEIN
jgi:hypothetical protein